MIINIAKIYEKNISNKFDGTNRKEYQKIFTDKEREMWEFTLELLKDNFPTEEYDDVNISNRLIEYHKLYLLCGSIKFTLNDWFDFMRKMK